MISNIKKYCKVKVLDSNHHLFKNKMMIACMTNTGMVSMMNITIATINVAVLSHNFLGCSDQPVCDLYEFF